MGKSEPPWGELIRTSAIVGALGFGGPAGQIALMRRLFVERRGWISEEDYAHGLSFCLLLPGPEAQQLATYVGWRLKGLWGALIAGWLFVAPGALVVFALSWLYATAGALPVVEGLFLGVKCAVIALVVEALQRVGERALKGPSALVIAGLSFAALLLGAPFPVVILAAGLLGALRGSVGDQGGAPDEGALRPGAWRHALTWAVLWLAPLALSAALLGPGHVLTQVGLLFSVLACVTFGGAYAVLAYLSVEAAARGWLTQAQMIDGLGLAETTPGPLILVNQFVGFLAGWGEGGLALATLAALMASWCTFAPSFVWIFAGAPHLERLRRSARAQGALTAITAAVLGVIAKLALSFAVAVLLAPGAGSLPAVSDVRWPLVALSLLAGVALLRLHVPMLVVLGACALAGWGLRAAGLA